jgi:hypothetical protein
MTLVAAVFSILRGKKFVHDDAAMAAVGDERALEGDHA